MGTGGQPLSTAAHHQHHTVRLGSLAALGCNGAEGAHGIHHQLAPHLCHLHSMEVLALFKSGWGGQGGGGELHHKPVEILDVAASPVLHSRARESNTLTGGGEHPSLTQLACQTCRVKQQLKSPGCRVAAVSCCTTDPTVTKYLLGCPQLVESGQWSAWVDGWVDGETDR